MILELGALFLLGYGGGRLVHGHGAGAGATLGGLPLAHLTPKPGNAATAAKMRAVGERFDRLWPDITGRSGPMPPAAKEVAMAQIGGAEFTGYCTRGFKNPLVNGNCGGYQCRAGEHGTSYYDCEPQEDSEPMPDGSQRPFTTNFRAYKDGVTPDGKSRSKADAAAWDYLHSIARVFPALPQFESGSILAAARQLQIMGYYGGFNLTEAERKAWAPSIDYLVKRGGLDARAARVKVQPRVIAERIAKYAYAMGKPLPEIAAALGHDRVYATLPADLVDHHH